MSGKRSQRRLGGVEVTQRYEGMERGTGPVSHKMAGQSALLSFLYLSFPVSETRVETYPYRAMCGPR